MPLMALWIAQIAGLPRIASGQGAAGGIRGVVYDAEFLGPVPQATVRLLEASREQFTANDGHFVLGDVPPGAYTLTVSKPGYARFVQASVVVTPGALADVVVHLRGEFSEMEEFVVRDLDLKDTATEAGLLSLREESLTFQDSVGKEMMSKAGASDAAGALRLVVGASVVDGKYASVRGLSDRYVGAALNGIRVPSSDPKKRAIQLDVFPAGTIESISVTKTFTPDLPGDYTGGGINIRTIGLPEKNFVKFGFGREINRSTTGKDGFVTYDGAGIDRWARHRGSRGMPPGADTMEADNLRDRGLPSAHTDPATDPRNDSQNYKDYDRITRSFASAMGTKRIPVPDGNHSYDLSLGHRRNLGGAWDLGIIGALTYNKKYTFTDATEATYRSPPQGTPADPTNTFTRATGTEDLKWSEMLAIGLARDDAHVITMTALRNRAASDRAAFRLRDSAGSGVAREEQSIHYMERSLDALQFKGEHHLEAPSDGNRFLDLNWFFARNRAEQEEPDVRYFENVVYPPSGTNTLWRRQQLADGASGAPDNLATRTWRNTLEQNSQYGFDVAKPFHYKVPDWNTSFLGFGDTANAWVEEEARFSMGLVRDFTHRTYRQNSFFYNFPSQNQPLFNGPVRGGFPNRPAYLAALAAWHASPAGLQYAAAMADAAEDLKLKSFESASADALWTDAFTDPNRIGLGSYSNSMYWYVVPRLDDIVYEGEQNLKSGWWMLDLPVTKQLKSVWGARLEVTDMKIFPKSDREGIEGIDPSQLFFIPQKQYITNAADEVRYYYYLDYIDQESAQASIQDSSWLRSFGLVYEVKPGMNVRFNWGQTIARPTFLELAPVITYDYIEDEAFAGNKDLVLSRITNRDLRWEWFPSADGVLAFSLFEKRIVDPIERESFAIGGQEFLMAVNYPEGKVSGFELEGRTALTFLPAPFDRLKVGANYTKINARVSIPDALSDNLEFHGIARTEREMEGQPSFLANFNLTYDIESWGTSFGWFYNLRGEMLKSGAAVGDTGATPDIFVDELASVSLSISQKIGKHAKLTLRAKNVTDPTVREFYREPVTEDRAEVRETTRRKYKEGVVYSASISAEW